jgi:hypothetical protein
MEYFWETGLERLIIFMTWFGGGFVLLVILTVLSALISRYFLSRELKKVIKLYKEKGVDLEYKFKYFPPNPSVMYEALEEALTIKENHRLKNMNFGNEGQYNYRIFKDNFGKLKVRVEDGMKFIISGENK